MTKKNKSMNMKTKNHTKPIAPKRIKKGFRRCAMAAMMVGVLLTAAMPAFATGGGDPIAVVNNLSDFVFGLIRAVGIIILGWGVVQVGMSFQSHDPSQRSNGFLTLAGGVVITFAREILNLIIG